MRSIAVLGGGGFLGAHFVRGLLARTRAEVEVVDINLEKLECAPLARTVRKTLASIDTPGLMERIVDEHEIIISMTAICTPAAYNTTPVAVIDANYTHLVPLVRLCTEARRYLVHLSTCEVYGKASDVALVEDSSPLLLGPVGAERWSYACAKQLLERLIWAHMTHHGLAATIVRPFNVIGPRMDFFPGIDGEGTPRVLANFMRALLNHEALPLVDGGEQRRAFLYVDDFTDALLRVIERPAARGQIFNIGNPDNDVSIAQLAKMMIAAFAERRGATKSQPREVDAAAFYGPGYDDVARRIPDIRKAQELLGWTPKTPLREMLAPIIDDYAARYGEHLAGDAS